MNTTINHKKNLKPQNNDSSSAIRVDIEIKNKILNEIDHLKKKRKGSGKINPSTILEKILPLISDQIRAEILSESVTGEDRQKAAFSNFKKKHKKATKSDFLDLIQYGEISINDYLPENMRKHKKTSELSA